jgi:hypothetical protein
MGLVLKCVEPAAAIGCALAALAAGGLDGGLAAGGIIGGAGVLARWREHRTKPGLEDGARIGKVQKIILRRMDRWNTDQETRDSITLADAAMARHLEAIMLSREELIDSTVSVEPFPDRTARLVAERLAALDPMFEAGSIPYVFAIDVIKTALEAAKDDPAYAARLTLEVGIRGNQEHANTQEKIDRLREEIGAAAASTDWWIDPETIEPLMDMGMPPAGLSEREVAAKAQLYGGKATLRLTPLDYVGLGHTFQREKVGHLATRIAASDRPCSSFTLKARRGAGLSIALAQLVRSFDMDPRVRVFSVIGNRSRTLHLLEALSRWQSKARALADWAQEQAGEVDRILLVIDDVWGDAPIGEVYLIHFRNLCSELFTRNNGPKLSFVFGSFGAAKGLDEDGPVPLKLTDLDRAACYAKMAEAEPTIIRGYAGGMPEARQIGDDAQALIDFHLQHGRPHRATVEHWLARLDDLTDVQVTMLAAIAAAELLDLAVPESVAVRLCTARGIAGRADVEEIVAANDRLTILDEGGPAVGLSCPWRAKSILQRSERLTHEFLLPTFQEMIEAALAIYESGRDDARQCLDFARHVFQRLGKREYYPLKDKEQMGREVLGRFLDRLATLSGQWTVEERAKWAGTIAPWADRPRPRRAEEPGERAFRLHCAEFVGRLTEKCLNAIKSGEARLSPGIAVSLLRASRLLLSSQLYPKRAGDRDPSLILAEHLDFRLSKVGILELVEIQLDVDSDDRGYRVNELLTAYGRFRAQWVATTGGDAVAPPRGLSDYMSWIMGRAIKMLNRQQLTFDAGTYIERARFEFLPEFGPDRDRALRERHRYLNRAEECVRRNPVGQATWEARVRAARSTLATRPTRRARL